MQSLLLTSTWQLKQRQSDRSVSDDFASAADWLPASVPGTVHQDLLAAGRIPDPFYGLNENQVQWVGETDWLYRCTFEVPADWLTASQLDLVFEGLDTFATLWLNGTQILSTANMFRPYRVSVKPWLKAGSNELRILFESAWRRGREIEAGQQVRAVWNTDASRVYVRKAQYQYGWDWGPTLLTSGPWRPVRLEAYAARVAELHCPVEVAPDLQTASLPVAVKVDGDGPANLTVRLTLQDPAGVEVAAASAPVHAGQARHTFTLPQPQLWWPNGYGAQPLYTLTATLTVPGQPPHSVSQRLGLRRLRLVQEPLAGEASRSFYFEVNQTPIFCGGANWIPADNFVPRLTPADYRRWLELARATHMQMLRVWGGGIYEQDIFYDLCDELGLLIWQDFMFACGLYPADPEFLANVRAEAEANVRRLRHHPCLALWNGNNEDYSIAKSRHLYDPAFNGDFTASPFPAREIYERLLPDVCNRLDPTRAYWPGSPYNYDPTTGTDDERLGDGHMWQVWHGAAEPYQLYPTLATRFASEFGMQAFPNRTLIESFAPPGERHSLSRTLEFHNKATSGSRRLALYLSDNVNVPNDLDSRIYATQFVQAEAVAYALRGWRRRWGQPGRRLTGGALIWQLNDCWPAISWAIADNRVGLKPACFTTQRALAPVAVGLAKANAQVTAWAVNSTAAPIEGVLEIKTWSLAGQCHATRQLPVMLPPHHVTEWPPLPAPAEEVILAARLHVGDVVVARDTLWPEPFKYLALPEPGLTITRLNQERLKIETQRPVKGLWLQADAGVTWSDNWLDVLPDDPQLLTVTGLGAGPVHAGWLMEEQIGRKDF